MSKVYELFLNSSLQEKKYFDEGLFLYYTGVNFLLSHLFKVVISSTKPSLENVFHGVFLNLKKSRSEIPCV